MSQEHLRLFGRPELRSLERRDYLESNQVDRFLVHLAYRGAWVPRDELIFLFWSDRTDAAGRRNLRKVLHRARRRVEGIETEGDRIRWLVRTDLTAWRAALGCGDAQRALELFRGPLLEGFLAGAEAEFANWLELERAQLRRELHAGVVARAERLEAADPAAAARLYGALIERDPLDEATLRRCLRCLARANRFGEVDRVYRAFRETLEREVAAEPEAATRALVRTLRAGVGELVPDAAERVAPRSPPWSVAPFVGRESELAWLDEALARALAGRGGVVAVEGEAGVGKSRLLEEFLARAEGARVFAGRCYERDLSAPLEAVRSALGAPEVRGSLASGGAARLMAADPRDRSAVHHALMARLVGAAEGRRGAALLVDDLQWADAATLEFVSYAAKRVQDEPVLLLLGHRREDRPKLEGLLDDLSEHRTLRTLRLERFGPEQTRRLVGEGAALGPEVLDRLAEFVHDEAEGNPFFALEYLRWLRDAGAFELGDDGRATGLRWERLAGIAMPEGIRSLIWARYRALEEPARAVLDVAATIGRTFDFDLLERVSGSDPLQLWTTLEPLIGAGIIVAHPDGRYAFSHDKLRQTVYDRLGPPVRRALHGRVAAAQEASGADSAELAHHFLRSERWAEAYHHLQAAARSAEAESAWTVALQTYRRMLDLADRLEDPDRKRFEALQGTETILEFMDRKPEWFDTIAQLSALAERLGDPRSRAEAALKRMAMLSVRGDAGGAAEALAEADGIFADMGDEAARARARQELAYLAWMRGDYDGALDASFEALRIHRREGRRRAEAATTENIAHAYRWLGDEPEATRWGEAAAAIYLDLGDLLGEYLRLDTRAWALLHRGEETEAAALLERVLAICSRMEDKHLVVEKHMSLGRIYLGAGRYREALPHFEAASRLGAETGDPRHESFPLLSAGATLEQLGRGAEAARTYLRAARLLAFSHATTGAPEDEVGRGDALMMHGSASLRIPEEREAARVSLERAREIFERHDDPYRLSKVSLELGALQWRVGALSDAAGSYRRAAELADRAGLAERATAALASLGVVYRDLGELERSLTVGREALARLRRGDDPLGEAYLLSSVAETLRRAGRDAEARRSLERSLELRRAVGDAAGEAATLRELERASGRAKD